MESAAIEIGNFDAKACSGKYLNFLLGGEYHGFELGKVREIIGMMKVTAVPNAPECMRGVINLRGKVIPVIDLRRRFGMPPQADTERTCIVVMQSKDLRQTATGVVVDEVCEVLDLNAEQLEPAPKMGVCAKHDVIIGIGKINNKVIMLLDGDLLLRLEQKSMSGEVL